MRNLGNVVEIRSAVSLKGKINYLRWIDIYALSLYAMPSEISIHDKGGTTLCKFNNDELRFYFLTEKLLTCYSILLRIILTMNII